MDGEHFDAATGEVVPVPAMPPAIAAAIIAVKKQVKQLGSDERNEHGRYSYVSVDKFYERIGKLMADAGLALLIDETTTEVRASDKSGNPWLFAQYTLSFMHESGAMSEALRRSIALPISGPQAFGAAQSYIEKQFLRQVFKVPTGDKDADDTKPGEDAPQARAGAATAQAGAPAARTAPARQQPAPARSPDQQEHIRLQRLLAQSIDESVTVAEVDNLTISQDWSDWRALGLKAVPEHEAIEARLLDRAEKRKAMLRQTTTADEGGYH